MMDNSAEQLNRWLVGDSVGMESSGEVLRCMCRQTRKLYAMKVQTEDLEERFLLHEFNICRLLHSTDCLPVYGVPKVFEYKSEPEYNFLVMQYTGMSLDDASKSVGGLPLKTTFTLGIELLKVLDRLHSNNVFHLDVCSQNVKVQHEYGEDGDDLSLIHI